DGRSRPCLGRRDAPGDRHHSRSGHLFPLQRARDRRSSARRSRRRAAHATGEWRHRHGQLLSRLYFPGGGGACRQPGRRGGAGEGPLYGSARAAEGGARCVGRSASTTGRHGFRRGRSCRPHPQDRRRRSCRHRVGLRRHRGPASGGNGWGGQISRPVPRAGPPRLERRGPGQAFRRKHAGGHGAGGTGRRLDARRSTAYRDDWGARRPPSLIEEKGPMLRCLVVVFALCSAATAGPPAEAQPARPALRFCGTGGLRAYLLSTDAGPYYGLLLHQLAIIDESDTPFEVNEVEFALLDNERVVETRLLSGPDLQRLAEASRQIEAAPIAKASIDLICGDRQVLPRGVRLGGPGLTKGEALLISNQVFAFRGRVRIRVIGTAAGRPAETKVTLPISTGVSKTHLRFPVRGTWVVKSGPSFDTHHRWALPSEFALDLVQFAPDGRSHTGAGTNMSDYRAYGRAVLAAADGRVVRAVSDRPEPSVLLTRPGEDIAAFSQRIAPYVQS